MNYHSDKQVVQIVKLYCKQYGVQHIVISPGSRCAPLIIEFTSDSHFQCHSVIDERSAGFIALGLAKATSAPVVLICTSGSAVLNYAPALSEAFNSNIPLLVLTADRPKNKINIGENQTIIQSKIYQNYIYSQVDIEEHESESDIHEKLFEAFVGLVDQNGPSHINIHLEEPLYQREDKEYSHREVIEIEPAEFEAFEIEDFEIKSPSPKVMIYISSIHKEAQLMDALKKWAQRNDTVICSELTANIQEIKTITNVDKCSRDIESKIDTYMPDILITIGGAMISKRFKTLLQNHLPLWHIDIHHTERSWNAFDTNFNFLHAHPFIGLDYLYSYLPPKENTYHSDWMQLSNNVHHDHKDFMSPNRLSEFCIIDQLMQQATENQIYMWGNSTSIRYAHWCYNQNKATHYANRGVSGIDGVLSTAIGLQLAHPDKDVICVLGDVSMIYESSALIYTQALDKIKIVILNNHGGRIFENIAPVASLAEREYFTTPQSLSFEKMAGLYHLNYHKLDTSNFERSTIFDLIKKTSKECIEIDFPDGSNEEWHEYFK